MTTRLRLNILRLIKELKKTDGDDVQMLINREKRGLLIAREGVKNINITERSCAKLRQDEIETREVLKQRIHESSIILDTIHFLQGKNL